MSSVDRGGVLPREEAKHCSILVAEDGHRFQKRLRELFPVSQHEVAHEHTLGRALKHVESEPIDLIVVSSGAVKGGRAETLDVLERLSATSPATPILFIAGPKSIRTAVSTLEVGTYQYAKMPVSDHELRLLIETALRNRPHLPQDSTPQAKSSRYGDMIGTSKSMQAVYAQVKQAAGTSIPVLLLGETGTGKDLAAMEIHRRSGKGPFVPVNLGSLPRELVATELFGHEKGVFTGASEKREGKFELARDGTVFLDEISSIDEKVQVSLLRVIEQRKFHRLGGKKSIESNARLIAATNQKLEDAVATGTFRNDLFYRLDVFRICLPPLRDREGDIPLLVDEFSSRYAGELQKDITRISPRYMELLERYDWPGNVRELKNAVQRSVLVCRGKCLTPKHLPPRLTRDRPARPALSFELGTPLEEIEREVVSRTLALAGGSRKRAAEILGISRRSLYRRLRKHGVR
jgi:DNA-binding NtrC family response regulator